MVSVVVLDYDAGNLRSVETALRRLGARFTVSRDAETVAASQRLIIPGVGDARAAMTTLDREGLSAAIYAVAERGRPVFGICLGSQIVLDRSEENDARCLGLIAGTAREFQPRPGIKIPHMGWNTIDLTKEHPLTEGIPTEASFYFVHSYYPQPRDETAVLATTEYGLRFASIVGRETVVATQFHPEKSGEFGLRMLQNFLEWTP